MSSNSFFFLTSGNSGCFYTCICFGSFINFGYSRGVFSFGLVIEIYSISDFVLISSLFEKDYCFIKVELAGFYNKNYWMALL
ncbi:Protein of unknown function [Gryllus bimaculatus]|nr:Protein of unknown function [Gryllus bimaculatus]